LLAPIFRSQGRSATVYFLMTVSAPWTYRHRQPWSLLGHTGGTTGACGRPHALRNHSPPRAVLSSRRQQIPV